MQMCLDNMRLKLILSLFLLVMPLHLKNYSQPVLINFLMCIWKIWSYCFIFIFWFSETFKLVGFNCLTSLKASYSCTLLENKNEFDLCTWLMLNHCYLTKLHLCDPILWFHICMEWVWYHLITFVGLLSEIWYLYFSCRNIRDHQIIPRVPCAKTIFLPFYASSVASIWWIMCSWTQLQMCSTVLALFYLLFLMRCRLWSRYNSSRIS